MKLFFSILVIATMISWPSESSNDDYNRGYNDGWEDGWWTVGTTPAKTYSSTMKKW